MQSYKTFLNAVRVAISKAVNKVATRLARLEEQYNELAYVPIYETPIEDVWSGVLASDVVEIEDGFPELVVGKEYIVTIGDTEYRETAKLTLQNGQSIVYLGDDYFAGGLNLYSVLTAGGIGIIVINFDLLYQTMTIQLIGDTVEVGKERLRDYVDEAKSTAETAKSTAETAQSTAETAQSTAETAQSTAETAQSTAETAQSTAETAKNRIAMGFGTEIPSYRGNSEIEYAMFPNALEVNKQLAECRNLKEVYIHSAKKINSLAFQKCRSLTSFTIPDSVTSIGWAVFYTCYNLKSIAYTGTMEQWNAVSKSDGWNDSCPATEVVCYDGSVALTTEESTTTT